MTSIPASPPSLPESELSEVRQRIVHSALTLFADKGYAATSLREIAETARTTKPMIYYYFQSKEGLYTSILGDLLQAFADAIDASTHIGDSPRERLRAFASAYLGYFESREPYIAFVVREVFGLGADIMEEFGRELDHRIQSRLKRIITEGDEQGAFRPCDVEKCSIAVMGIVNMFILRRVFGAAPLERAAAVEQVVDYYLDGLLARP